MEIKISRDSNIECLIRDIKNAVGAHSRICISDRTGCGRGPKEVLFKPRKVGMRQVTLEKLCQRRLHVNLESRVSRENEREREKTEYTYMVLSRK